MKATEHSDSRPQLSVNFHIIEPCNYGCRYCFAEWRSCSKLPVVIDSHARILQFLDQLESLRDYPPISRGFSGIRLNIAGGEPLLKWKKGNVPFLLDKAHERGIPVSIITNASLLTHDILKEMAPRLQILGISMDSDKEEVNRSIGRVPKSSRDQSPGKSRPELISLVSSSAQARLPVSAERVSELFEHARIINPQIECKLNTVVNRYNWDDDMTDAIELIKPDRWKVFKMLEVTGSQDISRTAAQKDLKITQKEYRAYRIRHAKFTGIMQTEDNDEMTESYLMIDPYGRFFQNSPDTKDYCYSSSILEVGIIQALEDIRFDISKYEKRQK